MCSHDGCHKWSVKGETLKASEDTAIQSHTFAWWGEQTCPSPSPPPPLQTFVKFSGFPGATSWLVFSQQVTFKLGILTNKGILLSHIDRFLQTGPSQKLKKPVGLFFETTCLKSPWTPPKEEQVSEMNNLHLQIF